MSKHFDQMEPIFFTPPNQAANPVGGRRLFKGGGGGGERPATEEEKRLWKAQAESLEMLSEIAKPNLVTGMNNLGVMANESMDGTLAGRLRGMAGVDASQAAGEGLTAASRGLERYGSTMNPNAQAAITSQAGLEGAKLKSNAMNMANMAAEDVKWQRNAALTGLASGQGAQAVSGMGSLASQIGQSRQADNNAAAQNQAANAQSLAGIGSMAAYMMKADGGEVRLADGGQPGLQRFKPQSMPKLAPWDFSPESGVKNDRIGLGDIAGAVAMPVAMHYAAPLVKDGLSRIGSSIESAIGGSAPLPAGATPAATSNLGTGTGLGFGSLGLDAGATAATEAVGTGGAGFANGLGLTGASAAGGAAAGGAAAGSAGAAGAAAGTAATNAWNPIGWAAAGYLLGSALDLWADGGDVSRGRVDMTPGGAVKGAGTETSDSIPAWLSDKEFVNNADSVQMPRSESHQIVRDWIAKGGTTKDLLNELNNAGLRKRGKPPVKLAEAKGGTLRAAGGGLAAIGNFARGFVPTAMDIDRYNERTRRDDARTAEDTRRWDATHGLALANQQRTNELFDMQKQDRAEEQKRRAGVQDALRRAQGDLTGMADLIKRRSSGEIGDDEFIGAVAPGAQSMGVSINRSPTGGFVVSDGGKQTTFKTGGELASYLADPTHAQRRILAAYTEAAEFDPGMADKAMSAIYKNAEAMRHEKEFEAKYGKDGKGGVYGIGGLYDRANSDRHDAALARLAAKQPTSMVKPNFFASNFFDKDSPQAAQAHQAYVDLVGDLQSEGADPSLAEQTARRLIREAIDAMKDGDATMPFSSYIDGKIKEKRSRKAPDGEGKSGRPDKGRSQDDKKPGLRREHQEAINPLPEHERGLLASLRRNIPAWDEQRKRTLEERASRLRPGLERISPAQ